MENSKKQQALDYHSKGRAGKIEIKPTKPCLTSSDLSLAYSPYVAEPCMEIAKNPEEVFKYTAKGNLVGIISNGTAVLGLGNIGPKAAKPVMEGKAVLFKRFADVDVFDIELNATTVDEMVNAIKPLQPTFGGINLEDIKAPECFELEARLQEMMDIPVFHDDQHGTAIIAAAGFLNAVEISGKKIDQIKVIFSGAGAASIACARLFLKIGVTKENLIMTDSRGVIYKGRTAGMNKYKEEFANDTPLRTLDEAMKDADAFIGCSAKGVVNQDMVRSMGPSPIIFAMANPDPEILPEEIEEVRQDAFIATGRSDYPNQVNNVLGFPFIFRGALDVRARKINEEMKIAAVYALANLAKEEVPDDVRAAYGDQDFSFGKNYLIPKPFDKRVLTRVAPAVAKAAIDSGVARKTIDNFYLYARELEERLGQSAAFMRSIRRRIPEQKKRIVFTEGTSTRILKSVSSLHEEGKIIPILLGNKNTIHEKMDSLGLSHLKELEVITPTKDSRYKEFSYLYHQERQRKGANYALAESVMKQGNYFASMLVREKHADGMITGATSNYPACFRPIMRVLGKDRTEKASGVIILIFKNKILFLGDCTVKQNPTAEDLSDTALSITELYRKLMQKDPSIAFLSYSNFGANINDDTKKIIKAVELTKQKEPGLMVDGEMQADVAINDKIREHLFKFSTLKRSADVLIFPDLQSANISYKLLSQLSDDCIAIGPILTPMNYAANIVQRTSTVEEIINMTHLTALISERIHQEENQ